MDIIVTLIDGARGRLRFGSLDVDCALGKSGITTEKREGDHATPAGRFSLRKLFYRADRMAAPRCALPTAEIDILDGWCDDPDHELYNRYVRLPFGARHERLWREDPLYDLVVVLGHNDDPPFAGAGSCIFLHVAHDDYRGTEGCVALKKEDLLTLLAAIGEDTRMEVRAP